MQLNEADLDISQEDIPSQWSYKMYFLLEDAETTCFRLLQTKEGPEQLWEWKKSLQERWKCTVDREDDVHPLDQE